MNGGYAGKIMYVDLSRGEVKVEPTPELLRQQFIGGCGFGAKLLYDTVPPGADPLGPDNAVVIATGPLTGTLIPSSAMTSTSSRSPLTGMIIRSVMGGYFGSELKAAGYDALVIQGRAEEAVYLYIDDRGAHIRPAAHVWGKNALEAQLALKKELNNPDVQVACIGPAGENQVRYACIIAGTRASGRGGLGAVLGSKNLKAVAVYGTQTIRVADRRLVMDIASSITRKLQEHPAGKSFPKYGSTASPASYSAVGIFGTRNWQTEVFESAEAISGETNMKRGLHVRTRACQGCILRSSHVWRCGKGAHAGTLAEGPEYETIWAFGAMCGNSDFDSIVAADRMCDELGLDTMTAGTTIAFAMECFEKGLIGEKDTGGLRLTFGNSDAILQLIPQIARKEGFGALLAEGSQRLAQTIGQGSDAFLSTVKGLEIAGHSPRAHKGQAVGYATSNRGGSHQDTRVAPERSGKFDRTAVEGKGKLAKDSQDMTTIGDALVVCRRATEAAFGFFLTEELARVINAVTGRDYSVEDLRAIAERIYAMERLFNVREGALRKDDTLPKRVMFEPIPDGPSKGLYVPSEQLDRMLDEYYEVRGWDKERACPTEQTLKRLSLAGYL